MRPVGRPRQAGFTLVEVMIALAILAVSLTVIMRVVADNVATTQEAAALSTATDLARGKMYDVEEQLMKEGFLDTDQSTEGDFGDQGWPNMTWTSKVEIAELPSYDQLVGLQQAGAAGTAGEPGANGEPASEAGGGLVGMLGLLGGGGGETDAADAGGASFIQSQFALVQEVLKAAMRKVTVTVSYKVLGEPQTLDFVAYFTDPAGMTKVLGSLGTTSSDGGGTGAGGTGTGGTGTGGTGGTGTGGTGKGGGTRR